MDMLSPSNPKWFSYNTCADKPWHFCHYFLFILNIRNIGMIIFIQVFYICISFIQHILHDMPCEVLDRINEVQPNNRFKVTVHH